MNQRFHAMHVLDEPVVVVQPVARSFSARYAGRTVVAVGAHPDDVELGIGGTLAALSEGGARVVMAICSVPVNLETRYAEATGCRTLRIKHNNVLGYYIEVPQAVGEACLKGLMQDFVHRQTMVDAMRFTSVELGELESKIAGASLRSVWLSTISTVPLPPYENVALPLSSSQDVE